MKIYKNKRNENTCTYPYNKYFFLKQVSLNAIFTSFIEYHNVQCIPICLFVLFIV